MSGPIRQKPNDSVMLEAFALLGLQEGDEIGVEYGCNNPYRVTDKGLLNARGNITEFITTEVLNGNAKFYKRPWVPKVVGGTAQIPKRLGI